VRSTRWLPDFRGVFATPETLRYIIAYAGNTWEVFAMRVWFVPFLAFNAALHPPADHRWNFSGACGNIGDRRSPGQHRRRRARISFRTGAGRVHSVSRIVAVSVVLGVFANTDFMVVVALLMLHGASSYGDAGAINGGLMASSRPEIRNAALALFGLFGFTSGFLGSLAVGFALQTTGGTFSETAWLAAFLVVGFGSVVSAAAMSRFFRLP
jgi:hypothetical protein